MENKKRPRVELTASLATTSTASLTTTRPTVAAQSFYLSNTADDYAGTSTSNVLFTICDDSSNGSSDYLCLNESLAPIKTEDGAAAALHCRIVDSLEVADCNASATSSASTALLPMTASMQLPSDCDIYLVKEYADDRELAAVSSATNEAKRQLETKAVCLESGEVQSKRRLIDAANPLSSTHVAEASNKRSYILDTYKKRDDKRRATHNEVERRRRDKINSWIFQLREMLPNMAAHNSVGNDVAKNEKLATTQERNNTNHSRNTPNDSKSQILIKACEYIRTMQEELKSLRKCLSENEALRLSNERLQSELDTLKKSSNPSASNHSVSSNNVHQFDETLSILSNGGAIASEAYMKRELIIRDYVD